MLESPEVNEYTKQEPPKEESDLLTTFKGLFKNPTTLAVTALVLGLVLGLIFGWFVWPVKWTDAPVDLLRADLQQEWVRMTADWQKIRTRQREDSFSQIWTK